MIHPWPSTGYLLDDNGNPEDPKYLYWNLSQWDQYNLRLMRTDLPRCRCRHSGMKHRSARAAAAMGVAALALSCAPACAHAKPQQPQSVTPQRDAPCSETLAGAMARVADGKTNLVCTDQGGGDRWSVFTSPYPLSDRWLTYGPDLLLHGQGMRNPELMSGRWTANRRNRMPCAGPNK
jgi:hypothetical protein